VSDFTTRELLTPNQRHERTVALLQEQRRLAVLRTVLEGTSVDDRLALLECLGLDPREGLRQLPDDLDVVSPIGVIRPSTAFNDPGRKPTKG
jgi:hypothetical protein